jgi:phosphoadenosine phosphosulfate reductase
VARARATGLRAEIPERLECSAPDALFVYRGWPMKLRDSIDTLKRVKERQEQCGHPPGIIVAYSGGKDSIICAELCLKVWPKDQVKGFYMAFGKNLTIETEMIDRGRRALGIEIDVTASPFQCAALNGGQMMHRRIKTRRKLKIKDIEMVMQSRHGLKWLCYGHRMNESLQRRGMLKAAKGYFPQFHKVYPIWDWSTQDAYLYLRGRKGLRFPEPICGPDTSGISLTVDSLEFIQRNFNEDYAKIKALFPFVDAKLLRETIRKRQEAIEEVVG